MVLRLSVAWMIFLENKITDKQTKLQMSTLNYVSAHTREQLKHTGRSCEATYI